jgi:hypothetical protein
MPMNEHQRRGRNNKRRGKMVEREVLRLIRALWQTTAWRNPDNGSQIADVESRESVYEVKSNQRPTPARRVKAWSQAKEAEKQTGKKPYVIETYIDNGKRTFWLIQELRWPEKVEGDELGHYRKVLFDPITEIGTIVINGVTFDVDPQSGTLVGENSRELAKHPNANLARKVVMKDYAKTVPYTDPMKRTQGVANVDF